MTLFSVSFEWVSVHLYIPTRSSVPNAPIHLSLLVFMYWHAQIYLCLFLFDVGLGMKLNQINHILLDEF